MPFETNESRHKSAWGALWSSGVLCRCPRCAKAPLFSGVTRVRDVCPNCNLDLSKNDVGDGPAPFITMILGAAMLVPAMWYEFTYNPPIWHHIVLWLPVIVVLNILMLRPMKSMLIAMQFYHKAGEDDATAAAWRGENANAKPKDAGSDLGSSD